MKKLILVLLFTPFLALADIGSPIPTDDFLKELLEFILSPKGGTLAVVVAVVQLVMMFLNTTLGSFVGKFKLAALYTLSAISTLVGMVASGMGWLEALLSGAVLAAIMNAVHQWVKPSPSETPVPAVNIKAKK